jgi:hypothetical protein
MPAAPDAYPSYSPAARSPASSNVCAARLNWSQACSTAADSPARGAQGSCEGARSRPAGADLERDGKGQKDQVTMVPDSLVLPLTHHLAAVKKQHDPDLSCGASAVQLPDAVARKYPAATHEWTWQWLFPATRQYTHASTQEIRPSPFPRNRHPACRPHRLSGRPHPQARHSAHPPPLLRHPPPRRRLRYPDHPGAARPPRRQHHHDLHPRPQPRSPRRPQSAGPQVKQHPVCYPTYGRARALDGLRGFRGLGPGPWGRGRTQSQGEVLFRHRAVAVEFPVR